ncbi:MAG: DUF1559 domain-containing protein [Planctomycetota bacterium]
MPYLYKCPHCETQTMVDDQYSGQTGQCVTCGSPIQLPHFAMGVTEQPKPRPERKAAGIGIAAVVAVILVGCLLYAVVRFGGQTVAKISNNRDQTQAVKNLEKISAALNSYADDHGSYPPPMTVDATNTPLHSWRVLLLPYLGEDELYNQFDLTVPWDHPKNEPLAYSVPSVYEHPRLSSFSESAYYLVTGKGTLFPPTGPLGPNSIVDDPSQTVLVVEAKVPIPSGMWTQPIDLEYAKMSGRLGRNVGVEPGGFFEEGVAMATVDGRGHFVPITIEPVTFRALLTPKGGERLPDDTLD